MFSNFSQALLELFVSSLWETIVMVGISGLVGALIGIPLGVLRLTDRAACCKTRASTAWWAAS
jgi:D-methionine transport system permease protein